MPNRHAVGHRDTNEKFITPVLTAAGKNYIQLHEGDGADLLVIDAPMYFVEIKNPEVKPSDRKLTPSELVLQSLCNAKGIGYYVIETPEQMADILNERNFSNGK